MVKTPLMAQYAKIKLANPDTILLFRIGDFYETFDEDAKTTAKVLGITLTKRSNGAAGDTPLAGFPHHAVDTYLPKLVKAGYRVAICEQTEDPKKAKGLVKREVIEVVTPGVVFSDKLLETKRNNYIMALFMHEDFIGVAYADISTGEFLVFETTENRLREEIELVAPVEILVQKKHKDILTAKIQKISIGIRVSKIDDWIYNKEYCSELIKNQFDTVTLKGFGIENYEYGVIAAGSLLHYLNDTQKAALPHLQNISVYNPTEYMLLDGATKRNLEIVTSMHEGQKEGSLFAILDKTETPMGGRLLKKWITAPLKELEPILQRQNSVEELLVKKEIRKELNNILREIGDLERLISRISTGRANPRELVALKTALSKVPQIKSVLTNIEYKTLKNVRDQLINLDTLITEIDTSLVEYPPINLALGGVIRTGYSIELDELRDITFSGKDKIARLQANERERTGISSLKIQFNKVFGYFIEVSNANKDKIPSDYIRKQTMVNAERYITPELKEFEEKVLNAEEKIYELESQLFNEVRLNIAASTSEIQKNARMIGILDCLLSFAECADEYGYIKPNITDSDELAIIDGRHPVVERILPPGEKFTPNSVQLNNSDSQIIVLTGPNMAGKSVYLRQVGLIVLLAQIGSYVPAKEANISIVDRIFTRVGASDNISSGESTFLVEMQEAANILNNATNKSLILLDEIGRGTSTFDGLSIAWAITEFLHENPRVTAKTLFATHYHELNEMADIYAGIKNYMVEVREIEDKVLFLHRVSPGSADHSYGIQVAQMAGMPKYVTDRAKEILKNLESKELTPYEMKKQKSNKTRQLDEIQLNLFEFSDDTIRKEIADLNLDSYTPIQALNKLDELKKKANDLNFKAQ